MDYSKQNQGQVHQPYPSQNLHNSQAPPPYAIPGSTPYPPPYSIATFPGEPQSNQSPAPAYNPYHPGGAAPQNSAHPQQGQGQQPQSGYTNNENQMGNNAGFVPQVGFQSPNSYPAQTPAYEPKPEDNFPYANDITNQMDFSEKSIRMAFIRKVYSILSVQLGVTAALIALFIYHPEVRKFTKSNPIFYIVVYVAFIVTLLTLVCCSSVRRKTPGNFICLTVFTIATGMLLGVISAKHDQSVVILAAGSTVVICVGLTLFAFQTKWDFTRLNGTLFVVALVFMIFGILTASLRGSGEFPVLKMVFAGIGVLIFSIYLVHDTQLMVGGNHKYALSPEEYIFATLNIYLDVIMIFLYLLQIFDSK